MIPLFVCLVATCEDCHKNRVFYQMVLDRQNRQQGFLNKRTPGFYPGIFMLLKRLTTGTGLLDYCCRFFSGSCWLG